MPYGLTRLNSSRRSSGPGSAAPDASGTTYTVSGLKNGSTAILYGNGAQISSVTVDGTGKATWTLGSAPAAGTIITYDGVYVGSGGVVASPTPTLGPTTLTITAGSTTPIPITGLASGQTVTSASGGWTVSGNSIVPPAGTVAGSLSVTVGTSTGQSQVIAVTVGAVSIPSFIIDTDFAGDPDDVGGLAILAKAHKDGTINILGINVSSTVATSAPGVRGWLNGMGLSAIPVSSYKGALGTYNNNYSKMMATRFGNGEADVRTNYPDDVVSLRTWLAGSAGPVVLAELGAPVSLNRLLLSPADGISPLTGTQLCSAKLDKTGRNCCIIGDFNVATPEYNATRDIASTQSFVANWPSDVPLAWLGFTPGSTVFSGPSLAADTRTDPTRFAYLTAYLTTADYISNGGRRESWDVMVCDFTLNGAQSLYGFGGQNGNVTVAGNGQTTFSTASAGPHSWLSKVASNAAIGASLDTKIRAAEVGDGASANASRIVFPINEGTGQILNEVTQPKVKLLLGTYEGTEATDPAWATGPTGLTFNGTSSVALIEPRPAFENVNLYVGAVVNFASITGVKQIATRWGVDNSSRLQFRQTAGKLELVCITAAGVGLLATETGTSVVAGENAMFSALINGTTWTMFKNGISISTGTFTGTPRIDATTGQAPIILGARRNPTTNVALEWFSGLLLGFCYHAGALSADRTTNDQALRDIATAKGITLP